MYSGKYAIENPDKPAFIMAETGEAVSYRDYEARCNRLAHLLRAQGLEFRDHYAIFMENNVRYMESCGAGERAGLYYTCINSYLTADELAYIVNNSESRVLITSQALRAVALAALAKCPNVRLCLIADGPGESAAVVNLDEATAAFPDGPIADECRGLAMLYSSGTMGRAAPDESAPLHKFLQNLWQYREGMTFLAPAPLYHSAPQASVNFTIRFGGTNIIMERFDPENYLALVEKYQITLSQLVPTMFSRMLKLPPETRQRFDLSSLEFAVHAAAPTLSRSKNR